MALSGICKGLVKWFWDWETLISNRHVGKYINGSESVHGGSGFGIRNIEKCCLKFVMKKNCVLQIHGFTKKKKKSNIQIRTYLRDVKVIPEKLQNGLVVTDMIEK